MTHENMVRRLIDEPAQGREWLSSGTEQAQRDRERLWMVAQEIGDRGVMELVAQVRRDRERWRELAKASLARGAPNLAAVAVSYACDCDATLRAALGREDGT